jgi:hypothetical protein
MAGCHRTYSLTCSVSTCRSYWASVPLSPHLMLLRSFIPTYLIVRLDVFRDIREEPLDGLARVLQSKKIRGW